MSFDGFVESVLINISSRKFVIFSDTGEERYIKCETPDEFMGVLKICKQKLTPYEQSEKLRKEQEYVLSKIRDYKEIHKSSSMITNLPTA